MRHRMTRGGFTLMEIMVVVIIIGVLAAIVVPQYVRHAERAKVEATKAQIKIIEDALSEYKLDTGKFPTTSQGLVALVKKPAGYSGDWPRGGYLPEVPGDAWGNDFVYVSPASDKDYQIISYGADGEQGGEDEYADIKS